MTDAELHALAEHLREVLDAFIKLQKQHEAELDEAHRVAMAYAEKDLDSSAVARAKLERVEAERNTAVAEALERVTQIVCHEAKGWDKQGNVVQANAILSLLPAIRSLSPDVGDKVLVPREPTEKMLFAYMDSVRDGKEATWYEAIKIGYHAMLTAAEGKP